MEPTTNRLILGDCIEKMKELPEASVDAVITDPPYGLEFMGKKWDGFGDNQKFQEFNRLWAIQALRVLKPGGFLFAMGGTRTHHRLTCGIEDAGFIVRDELCWVYMQGFPKAQDIASLIAKREGAKREGAGVSSGFVERPPESYCSEYQEYVLTENAKKWVGWKTPALKPAFEPIVVAQKPCEGSITENVMRYGVGGYAIDACRIPYQNEEDKESTAWGSGEDHSFAQGTSGYKRLPDNTIASDKGRFPPNLLMSDDVLNDGKEQNTGHVPKIGGEVGLHEGGWGEMQQDEKFLEDAGSFSKYFSLDSWWAERIKHLPRDVQKVYPFLFVPKVNQTERNEGLDDMPLGPAPATGRSRPSEGRKNALGKPRPNFHPTVKPISLMSYLITLSTREGTIILDPFMGSGTTGIAAHILNRSFVGVEKSEEYFKIAAARIGEARKQTKLVF